MKAAGTGGGRRRTKIHTYAHQKAEEDSDTVTASHWALFVCP